MSTAWEDYMQAVKHGTQEEINIALTNVRAKLAEQKTRTENSSTIVVEQADQNPRQVETCASRATFNTQRQDAHLLGSRKAAHAPRHDNVNLVRITSHDSGHETAQWPEPTPLPEGLPPVAAFFDELLPPQLQQYVADIAERMQCPPDFPAVALMTVISSVV